jgi:hypothetical protein
MELIYFRVTPKEWNPCNHLSNDASCTPDIHGNIILWASHEYLWRAIPQRYNLMRVLARAEGEHTREAEVTDLQKTVFVNQQILWLDIPVHDAIAV